MTADGKFITGAGKAYDNGRGVMKAILSFFEKLMTADGGLITGAGKAYDSGRRGFLCAFRFFLRKRFFHFLRNL